MLKKIRKQSSSRADRKKQVDAQQERARQLRSQRAAYLIKLYAKAFEARGCAVMTVRNTNAATLLIINPEKFVVFMATDGISIGITPIAIQRIPSTRYCLDKSVTQFFGNQILKLGLSPVLLSVEEPRQIEDVLALIDRLIRLQQPVEVPMPVLPPEQCSWFVVGDPRILEVAN